MILLDYPFRNSAPLSRFSFSSCAWASYGTNTLGNRRWTELRLGSTDRPPSCHGQDVTAFPPSYHAWNLCQITSSLRNASLPTPLPALSFLPAPFRLPWHEKYWGKKSCRIPTFRVIFCYLKNYSYQHLGKNHTPAPASGLPGLYWRPWNATAWAALCRSFHRLLRKHGLLERTGKLREDYSGQIGEQKTSTWTLSSITTFSEKNWSISLPLQSHALSVLLAPTLDSSR